MSTTFFHNNSLNTPIISTYFWNHLDSSSVTITTADDKLNNPHQNPLLYKEVSLRCKLCRRFGCLQCGHRNVNKSSICRNLLLEFEEVKYECTQCDFKTNTNYTLSTHIQSAHAWGFPCNQCGITFQVLDDLTEHICSEHS